MVFQNLLMSETRSWTQIQLDWATNAIDQLEERAFEDSAKLDLYGFEKK